MTDTRSTRRPKKLPAAAAFLALLLLVMLWALLLNDGADRSEQEAADYVQQSGGSIAVAAEVHGLPILNIRVSTRVAVTQVTIPLARLDDEMVNQLLKFQRLEAIALQAPQLDSADAAKNVSLSELRTAASPAALARLQEKFPELLVIVTPLTESGAKPESGAAR